MNPNYKSFLGLMDPWGGVTSSLFFGQLWDLYFGEFGDLYFGHFWDSWVPGAG